VVGYDATLAEKGVKNCILVDDGNEVFFLALKRDRQTLAVRVRVEISDVYAFCFGLACFMCKV
jgi:hypothetical protein